MNQEYIEFKKQRELSDVLSDTFTFLRQNIKPLFALVLSQVGPAFLLLALAIGYYNYITLGTMDGSFFLEITNESPVEVFIGIIVLIVAVVIFFSMLYGTILHYIKSYVQNNGHVNEEEVKNGAKKDFGSLAGLLVLVGIMVGFGILLCVIPGIYVAVPLSLSFSLLVFERRSVSDAISQSFTLVKDNWWMTFATIFVISLLVYIISMVFSIPMFIYMFIKGFTMAQEGSTANPQDFFDWFFVALNVVSTLIQYLLYSITTVAFAFIYFSLKEQKHFTGTFETIENLGKEKE